MPVIVIVMALALPLWRFGRWRITMVTGFALRGHLVRHGRLGSINVSG